MNLNEKLRYLRNEKGLSLRQLEKESYVLFGVICNLENGKTKNPQIKNICKLAVALEISLDDLIAETEFDFKEENKK